MLQTVFRIPHEFLGLPVFGWGWAIRLWVVAVVALLLIAAARPAHRRDVLGMAPMMAVLAAVLLWVLPFLEERGPRGDLLGLPIRGYGVMLLLGVVSGVGLTLRRAQRMGFDSERMLTMCFWMFAVGIFGARLFHVIQYWELIRDPDSWLKSLANAAKFSEGGLVVYGSLVGGLIAAVVYCRRQRWSLLQVGDVVAPGMMLGLALGRIGCLLNGCCHGGVCEDRWALTFPQGTHPYMKQLEEGELLGLRIEPDRRGLVVAAVNDGAAKVRGVRPGDRVLTMPGDKDLQYSRRVKDGRPMLVIQRRTGGNASWTASELPARSLPTRPAQIYSAVNAGLLCLLLLAWHPYRRRDGELIVLLLTLYPLTRFLLEQIRTDEPGRFGTQLTISQWVSVGVMLLAVALWGVVWRQSPRTRTHAANSTSK